MISFNCRCLQQVLCYVIFCSRRKVLASRPFLTPTILKKGCSWDVRRIESYDRQMMRKSQISNQAPYLLELGTERSVPSLQLVL